MKEKNRKLIEERLLSILHELLVELEADRALQAISLDASLERDLGLDSLGKVELFQRIEKAFSVRLPESAMAEAQSLHDLIKLIEQCANRTEQAPTHQFSPILKITDLDLSSAKTLVAVAFRIVVA